MDRLTGSSRRARLKPVRARRILVALLMVDLSFVLLHVFHVSAPTALSGTAWLTHEDLGIDQDRGLGELFQYLKLLVVVIVLALQFRYHRAYSAVAWAVAFGFALLDDAWQLHETVGTDLVTALDLTEVLGLRARDVGELLVWVAAGVVVGAGVLVAYLRAGESERGTSRNLAVLFGALLACGLVVDMLHIVIGGGFWMDLAFTLVEDGGELAVVSVVLHVVLTRAFVSDRERRRPHRTSAG